MELLGNQIIKVPSYIFIIYIYMPSFFHHSAACLVSIYYSQEPMQFSFLVRCLFYSDRTRFQNELKINTKLKCIIRLIKTMQSWQSKTKMMISSIYKLFLQKNRHFCCFL
jgi:hypothetical protein